MENYQESYRTSRTLGRKVNEEYPEFMKAMIGFAEACHKPGALDGKIKELITVALSVKAQCDHCIAVHVKNALDQGATKDEIMEAAFVAALMGGGPSYMYALNVRQAIEDLSQ